MAVAKSDDLSYEKRTPETCAAVTPDAASEARAWATSKLCATARSDE